MCYLQIFRTKNSKYGVFLVIRVHPPQTVNTHHPPDRVSFPSICPTKLRSASAFNCTVASFTHSYHLSATDTFHSHSFNYTPLLTPPTKLRSASASHCNAHSFTHIFPKHRLSCVFIHGFRLLQSFNPNPKTSLSFPYTIIPIQTFIL